VDLRELVRSRERVEVPNVPPGRYIIDERVVDVGGGWVTRREVIVSDEPSALIKLTPVSDAKIEVHLRSSDGATVPAGAATVSFIPTSTGLMALRLWRTTDYVLDPGTYWLSISTKQPFCAVSARLAGQEVLRRRVEAAPSMSARLDVELGSHCGGVDIRTVVDGKAVPFSDFLLLASGTPQDPGGVTTGSTDVHGRSSVGPLAPGRYLLWAWLPDGHGYIGPSPACYP